MTEAMRLRESLIRCMTSTGGLPEDACRKAIDQALFEFAGTTVYIPKSLAQPRPAQSKTA